VLDGGAYDIVCGIVVSMSKFADHLLRGRF
jgi:hypothetical protein